jgi:hypothetical protein
MGIGEFAAIAALVLTLIGASWKLYSEMASIKIGLREDITCIKLILERLVTKFEQFDKLEKRVDAMEKVFVDSTSLEKLEKKVDKVEAISTDVETFEKLEQRVGRLERKIFHMDDVVAQPSS